MMNLRPWPWHNVSRRGTTSRRLLLIPIVTLATALWLNALASAQSQRDGEAKSGTVPVPIPEQRDVAQKKVREIFRENYANSKIDADKIIVVEKLVKFAEESRDDAALKYACLDEARQLATEAGDLDKAFALVETLGSEFRIDPLELKSATLKSCAANFKAQLQNKELAERALPLVDQLSLGGKFQLASEVAIMAGQAAAKAKDKALQLEIQDLRRDLDELSKEFSVADKARESLRQKPDNVAAKLIWGRWVCLNQNNWDEGLKLLQDAGDEKLKELAARDLAQPTESESMTQLGNDWLEYAKSRKDHNLAEFATRALYWLLKAHPDASASMKPRIESLMEQAVSTRDWNSPLKLLLDSVVKKVVQQKYLKSEEAGRSVTGEFQELPPEGGVLVGFDCYTLPWLNRVFIRGLKPIFATRAGLKTGALMGLADGTLTELRARSGYAVSGIISESSDEGFANIRLTFARVTKSGLDPKRRYSSALVGRPRSTQPEQNLTSGNQPIVGVFGHASDFLRGLGIIISK